MKRRTQIFHLLVLATSSLAAAHFVLSAEPSERPNLDLGIPTRVESTLRVNRDPSFRTVVYKSEADGVKDIVPLAKTSEVEEAWAFLPSLGAWIEVGLNEKAQVRTGNSFLTEVELDEETFKRAFSKDLDLILYHFHPKKSQNLAVKAWVQQEKDAKREIDSEGLTLTQANISVQGTVPSQGDLLLLLWQQSWLERVVKQEKLDLKPAVVHKVVSAIGVTEYRVKKTMNGREAEEVTDEESKLLLTDLVDRVSAGTIAGRDHRPYKERIDVQDVLNTMNDESNFISFTFIPHPLTVPSLGK